MNEQRQANEPDRGSGYASVIKFSSWACALITALVCVYAFFVLMTPGDAAEVPEQFGRRRGRSPLTGLLMMPFGGYLVGMALAVLFAPTSYLLSEEGKQWMKKIGVKSVVAARVVSLIFVVFGLSFLTFFALALLTDDFKKPLL